MKIRLSASTVHRTRALIAAAVLVLICSPLAAGGSRAVAPLPAENAAAPAGSAEHSSGNPEPAAGESTGTAASEQSAGELVTGAEADAARDLLRDSVYRVFGSEETAAQIELLGTYRAQQAYIRGAAARSYLLPGLGQFRSGDILNGSLFLTGELALTAGIVLGVHALLPASVQVQNLDYLGQSFSSIEDAWKNLTPLSLIPSAACLAAAEIAHYFYRSWASNHARRSAADRIDSGAIEISPDPLFEPPAPSGH